MKVFAILSIALLGLATAIPAATSSSVTHALEKRAGGGFKKMFGISKGKGKESVTDAKVQQLKVEFPSVDAYTVYQRLAAARDNIDIARNNLKLDQAAALENAEIARSNLQLLEAKKELEKKNAKNEQIIKALYQPNSDEKRLQELGLQDATILVAARKPRARIPPLAVMDPEHSLDVSGVDHVHVAQAGPSRIPPPAVTDLDQHSNDVITRVHRKKRPVFWHPLTAETQNNQQLESNSPKNGEQSEVKSAVSSSKNGIPIVTLEDFDLE